MKIHFFSIVVFILLSSPVLAQVDTYGWPDTAPKSDLYEIKVFQNGNEYEIYPHFSEPYDKSKWGDLPERDNGNGTGVAGYIQDRSMTFGAFAFDGEITIEVTKKYGQPATSVEVAPKAFGINPTSFNGYTVRFKLNHNVSSIAKYIAVDFISNDNLDDDGQGGEQIKNALMLFADRPEFNAPNEFASNVAVFGEDANYQNADIIYFRKGDYFLYDYFNDTYGTEGQMPYFKPNQTIYFEPGTIIRGAFDGKRMSGLTLKGRALITGQNYPAEMGLNPKLAKRAGLLHDIGKVPETDSETPHALLGMEWAEKHGEKPEVCNAIGAHHDEIEMTSLLSPIVQVCDAISGARPGARRQVLDSYIQRLKDLEDIAFGFQGVQKAYAIQAGRELRVIVESEKVSDEKAAALSFEISQKIQTDMTYPGQVKITVIRETRAVNVAK